MSANSIVASFDTNSDLWGSEKISDVEILRRDRDNNILSISCSGVEYSLEDTVCSDRGEIGSILGFDNAPLGILVSINDESGFIKMLELEQISLKRRAG